MKVPFSGAIDCDLHPGMPSAQDLLPYLDDYWRDQITSRYIDRYTFVLTSYPPNAPLSCRPDWREEGKFPGGGLDAIRRNVLDPFGLRYGICNTLHGAIALFHEDMSAALCAAVNNWAREHLLDKEPRLRTSILVSPQNPELAVAEIERLADDRRFVQVLLLVMGDMLLGRRLYWPLYAAAEKHGLTVGIHAGGTYRYAPTGSGWPGHKVEDYIAQSAAFEGQLLSLLAEGVFQKFPGVKFVLAESGITWLPTLMWRTSKTWRGVRTEVPWLDQPPSDIIREHIRLTLQPVDAPQNDPQALRKTLEHIDSDDMLLFSTDYPHWHFDGRDVLPEGLPENLLQKIMIDNPLATYPRLREEGVLSDNRSETTESVR
jgi:predicted TIM-barrel fold metal-dependent hydrolase